MSSLSLIIINLTKSSAMKTIMCGDVTYKPNVVPNNTVKHKINVLSRIVVEHIFEMII